MDNRIELINALHILSQQCNVIAKLLETTLFNKIQNDTIICEPNNDLTIDVKSFEMWPEATRPINHTEISRKQAMNIGCNFSNSKIIEYTDGPSIPIGMNFESTEVDLIINGTNKVTDKCRIFNSISEVSGIYDVGIIYESLEFSEHPIDIILRMKRLIKKGGKIFIRFKPWSSRDGGFQNINKSYAHLVMQTNSAVKFKVIRPLATYDDIFSKSKLAILYRKITSVPPDDFIINNDGIMSTIISRTWGTINKEDAIKIMATSTIDFLLEC